MLYVEFEKNFSDADRATWWQLEPFRPPEAKSVWFQLSRHDVRRVHEKFSSRLIRASYWLLDSFWPAEPKNVSLLLSRHDVRRVHEKFFSPDSSELMPVRPISARLSSKTFDSYFLDMLYVEFMKNFLLADPSELLAVRLILAPEPKNVWFLLSRHDVRRVHVELGVIHEKKHFLLDRLEFELNGS